MKGAEKGITRSGRSVRAAVEERLPATQEDVRDPGRAAQIGSASMPSSSGCRPRPAGAKRAKAKPAKAKSGQGREEAQALTECRAAAS